MITMDTKHNQILSSLCKNCQDPDFQPPDASFIKVGCCSYSPKISLFELYKMTKVNRYDLIDTLLNNAQNSICQYTITVQAEVNPTFYQINTAHLTKIESIDLRIKHSVCQFFQANKGCSLPSSFKTSICRSFICSTVENKMTTSEKEAFQQMVKAIHQEANDFQERHQKILEEKGISLINQPEEVLQYLTQLE